MSKNHKTEIRFLVDQDYLSDLQRRLGITKGTELAKSAFTLLDWASSETQGGRIILSSTEDGEELHRLVMPELLKSGGREPSGG